MQLNNLNEQLLLEMDFDSLRKSYERAVAVLQNDVNVKINLEAIKEFILNWRSFATKYTSSKKRISDIVIQGRLVIKDIKERISKLSSTVYINLDELQPLIDYLDDFKQEVDLHIKKEEIKYKGAGR